MTYFNELLQKRGLNDCPLPLWTLKLTNEEYETLRKVLKNRTHYCYPFKGYEREATLFFSEYWRREYKAGVDHSKQMVFDALGSTRTSKDLHDKLYEAAREGAGRLHIERYAGNKAQPLEDMLYQGGLPMCCLTEKSTGVWYEFARGLVNQHIDFDELQLGKVATQSQSLRDFCNLLIDAIEEDDADKMPFHCQTGNEWYTFLHTLARQERDKRRRTHPFTLSWLFKVNSVDKRIEPRYAVQGAPRLSTAFLNEHAISGNFLSVEVRKNGQPRDVFEYIKDRCRISFRVNRSCHDGDTIALHLGSKAEALWSTCLDLSIPHLIYQHTHDRYYEEGNGIGRQDMLLLLPEGWHCEPFTSEPYQCGEASIDVMKIPHTQTDDIVVTNNQGEQITYGQQVARYWTETLSAPLAPLSLPASTPLYDARRCVFWLCEAKAGGDVRRQKAPRMEYRRKGEQEWQSEPPYGEIYARAVDSEKHYVAPLRLVNVGEGITVKVVEADKDHGRIDVQWAHGRVTSAEGHRREDGLWEFDRQACTNPLHIALTFIPTDESRSQFTLSLMAPFRSFSITDHDGERVRTGSAIPLADIERYQYHLLGQDINQYVYGHHRRSLKDGEIWEDGKKIKTAGAEGSLLSLLGTREELRLILSRTSKDMIHADIPLELTTSDYTTTRIYLKESPYVARQTDARHIEVESGTPFRGKLLLLPFDHPDIVPKEMNYDEGYELPEEIATWGKTLLFGRAQGRVRPLMVEYGREIGDDERKNNRKDVKAQILDELKEAQIGDKTWQRILGWYNNVREYGIPASSLLDLTCVAKDAQYLLMLAFQLYAQCESDDEGELLKEELIAFASDLSFQWHWLRPSLPFIPYLEPSDEMRVRWAIRNNSEPSQLTAHFAEWMKGLAIASLTTSYEGEADPSTLSLAEAIIKEPHLAPLASDGEREDYVLHNQETLHSATDKFFEDFPATGSHNERWLSQRVSAVAAHYNQDNRQVGLLQATGEVRRSIIFCNKSSCKQFITTLYDKLSRQ